MIVGNKLKRPRFYIINVNKNKNKPQFLKNFNIVFYLFKKRPQFKDIE